LNSVWWRVPTATAPESHLGYHLGVLVDKVGCVHFTPEKAGVASYAAAKAVAAAQGATDENAPQCPPRDAERVSQAHVLRDLFGTPPRALCSDPAWLTPAVTGLATAAYEERALPSGELDPVLLLVLADALEEAGCTDVAILGHLRGPGPHVRGCFVLDLLLGKS
jgi:hypothetical protein